MYGERRYKSAFGHICEGGGAEITNSPINVHIHIHTNDATVGQKIARALNGLFNKERHRTIEGATQLSEHELQGVVLRELENG